MSKIVRPGEASMPSYAGSARVNLGHFTWKHIAAALVYALLDIADAIRTSKTNASRSTDA